MEVTVEVTQGLERQMTVSIPDNDITAQIEKRLRKLAKTVRMQGFRPGKVPFKMVTRQYRGQVEAEVMGDLIQSSYGEALSQESIVPASSPALQSRDLKDDGVFEYAVTFEVYPEIEIQGLDNIKLEKPVVEITDDNVEKMIETLRQQRATWDEVERPSQKDDRIIIDFEGEIEGEVFDGGSTKGMPVVIGTGAMLKEFEENLVGLKAGEEKKFDVLFPEDYHGKAVAGKTAQFTVNVVSVNAPVLPELDEEFAKSFGVEDGNIEQLRTDIRDNMQRELDQTVRTNVKNDLMDALLEQNDIEVPNAVVDEEVARLRESSKEEMKRAGQSGEIDLPSSMFEDQARRRVKLGLLVGEVIKSNSLEMDNEKLEEEIKTIASTYEESDAVEKAYRERADLKQGLEAVVMENQVVDTLLEQITVNEVTKDFYDVVQSRV